VSWLYLRVLHHIDRLSYRLTRGRHTLSGWLTGLPVIILTTTGAKTGRQRTSPVVGVPDGDNPNRRIPVVMLRPVSGQDHLT
jgi:hypothetical protein